MHCILVRLEPGAIAATWPRIESMVATACKRSGGRYLAPDVRVLATHGEWQIWIAVNEHGILAVAGTEIISYPQLRAISIRFGIGRDRQSWQHYRDEIAAWGKAQGCTLIEGTVRKGWRRIFTGWLHTHDFIERKI